MNQNNQRIAKNTIFLYVRLAIVMIVNLYTTRIVLNALGVEDYGIYNVVCGFVSMFAFLNASMTNGIQRFYNYELGREGNGAVAKVYSTGLFIQGSLATLLVILLMTFGYWYLNTEIVIPTSRINAANWIYIFSVISTILVIMQAPYSAAVIAYEKMDYYALVSILCTLITLGIVCAIPHTDCDKLIMYGLLLMLVQVFSFVLYWGYCKYNFTHLKVQCNFDKRLLKDMFTFSGWNILGSFAFMLRNQGVNVLLNLFFGPIINAANGIASQVTSAVQAFSLNIMFAFQPQLVQSYASNDHKRTEQLMLSMTSVSYFLYCALAIPIVVEIEYILNIWLGGNVPEYTKQFIILTVIIMGLGLFHTSITQVFFAIGKLKKFQIFTGLIVCSILPISWVCLRSNASPTSVYLVTIIAFAINFLTCILLLHKEFKFNIQRYSLMIVKCTVVTFLTFWIVSYLNSIMPISLLRIVCVSALTLLLLIGGFLLTLSRAEKNSLIEIIKHKFCPDHP